MNCWWLIYVYRTIIGVVFLCVWLFLFVIWIRQLTECDITTPIYRWRNRTRKTEKLAQVEKPPLLYLPSDFKPIALFAPHNYLPGTTPLDLMTQVFLKSPAALVIHFPTMSFKDGLLIPLLSLYSMPAPCCLQSQRMLHVSIGDCTFWSQPTTNEVSFLMTPDNPIQFHQHHSLPSTTAILTSAMAAHNGHFDSEWKE